MSPEQFIKQARGKFFTARFVKKDGATRVMNCRTGVSKHVTGEGLKFSPTEKNLQGVYDVKAKGYRFIPLGERLLSLNCGKLSWSK